MAIMPSCVETHVENQKTVKKSISTSLRSGMRSLFYVRENGEIKNSIQVINQANGVTNTLIVLDPDGKEIFRQTTLL